MYNLFIVYLLQSLISQIILVFECCNMKCRLEGRSTNALVFQKVYMWCPCERHIHTYIHCSVSWSSVWCIYVLLLHWYTLSLYPYLNDHFLNMVSILNTHHNRTSFTNEINIYNFETFCVYIYLFMHTEHCNVFVQIHVNFSLFGVKNLFLSMYKKLFL